MYKVVKTIIFKAFFFACHFWPLKFSGGQPFGKFVKKKMKGALWPHQYFTPCPLKNVLPPFCPPGEKKLATPLIVSDRNKRNSKM